MIPLDFHIRRWADSGALRGAFLALTYHNGRCHCAVSSCKPCHRHMRCCDLEIRKNTVVPNLFVNWWCLVSFPHCIDHYFWTILCRVGLHPKGEDPWVAQPCWVVQEISVWFGLDKSANAHLSIGWHLQFEKCELLVCTDRLNQRERDL